MAAMPLDIADGDPGCAEVTPEVAVAPWDARTSTTTANAASSIAVALGSATARRRRRADPEAGPFDAAGSP
jgi:hypothetical protein